jgi:hypothetical protein
VRLASLHAELAAAAGELGDPAVVAGQSGLNQLAIFLMTAKGWECY